MSWLLFLLKVCLFLSHLNAFWVDKRILYMHGSTQGSIFLFASRIPPPLRGVLLIYFRMVNNHIFYHSWWVVSYRQVVNITFSIRSLNLLLKVEITTSKLCICGWLTRLLLASNRCTGDQLGKIYSGLLVLLDPFGSLFQLGFYKSLLHKTECTSICIPAWWCNTIFNIF